MTTEDRLEKTHVRIRAADAHLARLMGERLSLLAELTGAPKIGEEVQSFEEGKPLYVVTEYAANGHTLYAYGKRLLRNGELSRKAYAVSRYPIPLPYCGNKWRKRHE